MRLEAAPGSLQLGSPPDTRLVPGLSSDLGPPEPIHGPQRALWPHVCGSKAKVARATRGAVARGVLRAKPGPRERFFSAPAGSPGEKFPLPPRPTTRTPNGSAKAIGGGYLLGAHAGQGSWSRIASPSQEGRRGALARGIAGVPGAPGRRGSAEAGTPRRAGGRAGAELIKARGRGGRELPSRRPALLCLRELRSPLGRAVPRTDAGPGPTEEE